ncbi:MAG: SOS response-associated peptidase family protein, partial [Candidatus Thermoplasmatota archaeon]|nr:SOS response-associated peptidase family protein [Candidatus Thermoplasmatota archaeon]
NPDTKEEIFSFSLITCKANPLLEKIHNKKKRMPVILLKEVEEEYLRNTLKKDDIHEMLSPINDEYLEAHTISKRVTDKTNDRNVLSVIEPFDYSELPSI